MGQGMDTYTSDTFFNGRLQVGQFRSGYRFSIDSIILAHHVRLRPGEIVLDLGTGCGIVALILAYRHPESTVIGVEIQRVLADLACANMRANGMQDRVHILCRDMKGLTAANLPQPADWVVSNPPYHKNNAGRLNPNRQKAVARHEIEVTFEDIVITAAKTLRTGGRFITVYTADRSIEAMVHMRAAGIEPKLCRMIHSAESTNAKLVLIEGVKGARPGVVIPPPLKIYQEAGDYTEEIAEMFRA
jgi:tRNA1Val (adenine37-N6)-methyltransferase